MDVTRIIQDHYKLYYGRDAEMTNEHFNYLQSLLTFAIRQQDDDMDETAYLLSSEKNAARLLESVEQVKKLMSLDKGTQCC